VAPPLVSIILPTFNRARFLPDAFRSIEHQTWTHWELIIIDDGSTDQTGQVVAEWLTHATRPVKHIVQANRGAYGARNTGLDHAGGDYVAFFDSDDLWLPHHLERSVKAFERAPEADWMFAACRCVDGAGTIVQDTTFEVNGQPRPFVLLKTHDVGDVHVIDDAHAVECQLTHGIYCGLQNSVIRRSVFNGHRFWEEFRVVEDSLFTTRALVRGIRLAYLTDVHVLYRIHEGNSSGSATGASRDSLRRVFEEHLEGLPRVAREVALNRPQRRALQRKLAHRYFWDVGYVCCWEMGDAAGALRAFKAGLRLHPTDLKMWKTYLACASKTWLRRIVSPRRDRVHSS
jgi:glycosyltransferase involved in cell wall biosynthesis